MYPILFLINNYDLWLYVLFLGSFLVVNRMPRVLFDLGSSFSFISESFAAEIGDRPAKLAFHLDVVTLLGEHSLA